MKVVALCPELTPTIVARSAGAHARRKYILARGRRMHDKWSRPIGRSRSHACLK